MNKKGEIVYSRKFNVAEEVEPLCDFDSFHEGMASFRVNWKYGFILTSKEISSKNISQATRYTIKTALSFSICVLHFLKIYKGVNKKTDLFCGIF